MSTVDTRHPEYTKFIDDWNLMRDAYQGHSRIVSKKMIYLPMPEGWLIQKDGGTAMYNSYIGRAVFPEIVDPTLSGIVGIIHRKEVTIEGLPRSLEYMWERCTPDGLTLEEFHQKITTESLLVGGYNVLTEPDDDGFPQFVGYTAESRINWTSDRNLFVFDESGYERNGFQWDWVKRHRVLEMRAEQYYQDEYVDNEKIRTYPILRQGRRAMDYIPLVTVTPIDLAVDPMKSPLIGVGRSARAMYRLDADYKFQLFMSGQETLVVIGVDEGTNLPEVIGAAVVTGLPMGADMKYVGPSGVGIEAHERALEREKQAAVAAGTRLWDSSKKEAESGRALEIRAAAQTATFTTVSMASGKGLERSLRNAAYMLNEPESVIRGIIVKPNLDFVEYRMPAQDVVNMIQGWTDGAYSYDTLYRNLRRGTIASEERTAQQEQDQIKKERAAGIIPPAKTPATATAEGVRETGVNTGDEQ